MFGAVLLHKMVTVLCDFTFILIIVEKFSNLENEQENEVESFSTFYIYVSHSHVVSNFIYARKASLIHARTHVEFTQQWKSTLNLNQVLFCSSSTVVTKDHFILFGGGVGLGKHDKNSCTAFAEEIRIAHMDMTEMYFKLVK